MRRICISIILKYIESIKQWVGWNYIISQLIFFEMQPALQKQRQIDLGKVKLSSNFDSGNLKEAKLADNNQINLWVGSDPNSNYKTWFHFSIENVVVGTTVTFIVMNMSNQVKLFKEGHLPVFKTQKNSSWGRIKIPIQSNAIAKSQEGYKLSFKHLFNDPSKHYFAFSYPWTVQENQNFIEQLIQKNKNKAFCMYRDLAFTSNNRKVKLLTITKSKNQFKTEFIKIQNILSQVCTFPQKPGIFISARVHPGEVAASHILNGFLKTLFSGDKDTLTLLQRFVFYIVPIINPDGVAEGNFRTDSKGKNLNRFYTNPNLLEQPQIFGIRQFLVSMIKAKRIGFCLDLHAHVNRQGAFIYGNSITNLKGQMQVCLFPKILSFHSQYFDFESCNFSEKNMSSKDKADQLSKEGASRVAIFKETGLVQCWTLQCNYNSAKLINSLPKQTLQNKTNNVTNTTLISQVSPQQKQELKFFNIQQFQKIGNSIVQSIIDFYQLRQTSRVFGCKLKNMQNLKINVAVASLRMLPFRFDMDLRKVLNNINSQVRVQQALTTISNTLFSMKNKKHSNKSIVKEEKIIEKREKIKLVLPEKSIKQQERPFIPKTRSTNRNQSKIITNKIISMTAMVVNQSQSKHRSKPGSIRKIPSLKKQN